MAANQLMSHSDASGTVDFVYDSAGRLISEHKGGQVIAQYEYGYLDKVTQVTRDGEVTEFHYNARGMLVAKERDGQIVETFGWDGIGLIAKDDTVYANEAHISGGVPLAAIDAGSESAEMQYFDSDYLGTTTAVYSAEGAVDSKLAASFGAGTESDELRFTGKPYDADLDAHVFPYRNYKSEAGRWASADPAGFPDGPNQHYYACVPTLGLDPLGLFIVETFNPSVPDLLQSGWKIGEVVNHPGGAHPTEVAYDEQARIQMHLVGWEQILDGPTGNSGNPYTSVQASTSWTDSESWSFALEVQGVFTINYAGQDDPSFNIGTTFNAPRELEEGQYWGTNIMRATGKIEKQTRSNEWVGGDITDQNWGVSSFPMGSSYDSNEWGVQWVLMEQ